MLSPSRARVVVRAVRAAHARSRAPQRVLVTGGASGIGRGIVGVVVGGEVGAPAVRGARIGAPSPIRRRRRRRRGGDRAAYSATFVACAADAARCLRPTSSGVRRRRARRAREQRRRAPRRACPAAAAAVGRDANRCIAWPARAVPLRARRFSEGDSTTWRSTCAIGGIRAARRRRSRRPGAHPPRRRPRGARNQHARAHGATRGRDRARTRRRARLPSRREPHAPSAARSWRRWRSEPPPIDRSPFGVWGSTARAKSSACPAAEGA